MNMTTDQDYINKVLAGDAQAYTFLVNRYKDMVLTLALRMLRNREEAEEVAQDVFVKVYEKLSKFKGEAKFSTWLYKVVYNTCLDRIKKIRRGVLVVAMEDITERQIKTVDNALDQMELKERNDAIQECMLMLTADESALLTLFYFEELSFKEISKITGTSTNNLKVKLFRSRKKLALIMQEKIAPEIIESYG
tara:strand:- start:206990 stop:207568 length:579 start_codon:yes stop_codon:yes gene_type:complete